MSTFASLGLDPDLVRTDLQTLGIDDSVYTDEELASLMLVSNLALEQAISLKAEDVEELMFEYTYQADRLASMQSTLGRLLETIAVENAVASAAIDFLEGEDVYLDIGDASLIEIDYSWSWSDGTDTYTLDTFDSLQDLISAIANNSTVDYDDGSGSTTALEFGYAAGEAEGLFTGVVVDDSGNAASWSDFIGGGDYYLEVDSSIATYLDLDGFKQYLIAAALQESGYIGDDVELDPLFFASTSLAGDDFTDAVNWAKWMQLYFGRTTVAFDADVATLSVTYNGAAALREMGLSPADYFDDAEPELTDEVELYTSDTGALSWYSFDTFVSDFLPTPISEEGGNWLVALTASYVYGDLDALWALTSYGEFSFEWFENDAWSDYSGAELTAVQYSVGLLAEITYYSYLSADTLDDLLEEVGTAIQSQSSTGELALLEASTAITEWSELHNGWDTVHKYVTDALGRAVALIK